MFFTKRPDNNPQQIGRDIEQQAVNWLSQQGLSLISKNYHGPRGEIDLIMLDLNQLLFIEVRYRRYSSFGSAAETVTPRKQQKIQQTAEYFLSQQPQWRNYHCRFDVIAAQPSSDNATLSLNWIKNAFD